MKPSKACLAALLLVLVSRFALAAATFTLTVERNMSCRDGSTNGRLLVEGKEIARTLEPALPGNRIPTGEYDGMIRTDKDPKTGKDLGWRIELKDVPGWEHIEIHKGAYPSNTHGCILVGTDVVSAKDKNTEIDTCVVIDSTKALENVRAAMDAASNNGVSNQGLAIRIIVK